MTNLTDKSSTHQRKTQKCLSFISEPKLGIFNHVKGLHNYTIIITTEHYHKPNITVCTLSACLHAYLSLCLSACLYESRSVVGSVCLSACLSIYLSILLTFYQSIYLPTKSGVYSFCGYDASLQISADHSALGTYCGQH